MSIKKQSIIIAVLSCQLVIPCMIKSTHAQEHPSTSLSHRFSSDAKQSILGTAHILSKPWHWESKDWLTFGSVLAGTFAISFMDESIHEFFLKNQGKTGDKLANIGEIYGEPLFIILLTGSFYTYGLISDNQWLRETAVILTASVLPAGMIQTTAKMSFGRARPYVGFDYNYFDPFNQDEDYYSFVSGHTMVALSMSLVLAKRIDNSMAKFFLYGLGALSGISRLYNDEHWLSDVVLGSALSVASVNSVINWIKKKNQKSYSRAINFYFIPRKGSLNLTVCW